MRLPGRIPYALGGAIGRPRADRVVGGVDVFWAPAPAPIALSSGVPLVLSLHDLSWELRPSDFTSYERLWHRIARPRGLAERAARVVAVSDVTREQAIARWHLDPARVITIREGIRAPAGGAQGPTGIPTRYYLSVGALEPRKAPDVLVSAFRRARADGLEAGLVFVGEGRLRDRLSGDGVHVLGHVSDGDLAELYRGAVALVMPSRLEGFGLPPAEAALAGTPAIVTDLPVYRETLGEGALRVPVDDVPALASALLALERDQQLRARLSIVGPRPRPRPHPGAFGRRAARGAARGRRPLMRRPTQARAATGRVSRLGPFDAAMSATTPTASARTGTA